MRTKILIAFLLPLLAFSAVADFSINLDDRVSITFPTEPQEKESGGNLVWVADPNSDSRCMAMIVDFGKFGLDSAMLSAEMEKEESFSSFRDGVMGKIPGSTLISENRTKTGNYITFEYKINMGKTDPNALNVMYNRNIFVGNKLYSMSFFEKNDKTQEPIRSAFFNSFKVK